MNFLVLRASETTCENDGAANMSGIHRGVQVRIRERIPTAQYVHLKAIVHSSSDASVRNHIRLPLLF